MSEFWIYWTILKGTDFNACIDDWERRIKVKFLWSKKLKNAILRGFDTKLREYTP